MPVNPCNYIVYPDRAAGGFRADRADGSLVKADPSPEVVIREVLNQVDPYTNPEVGSGRIHVQSGVYKLGGNGSFRGFDLFPNTHITLDPTAYFIVPNGYAGYVFGLRSASTTGHTTPANPTGEVHGCILEGGILMEDGKDTVKRQWIGIWLEAASQDISRGVFFNRFADMTITNAKTGIKFSVTGNQGWINGNLFQFLKMWDNEIFIDFEFGAGVTYNGVGTATPGIGQNCFQSLQCQSGAHTRIGVNNIRNVGNTFIDVQIWDISTGDQKNPSDPDHPVKSKSAIIHSDASDTLIIGGSVAGRDPDPKRPDPKFEPRFHDNGLYTKILDQWQGLRFGNDTNHGTSASVINTTPAELLAFFGQKPAIRQAGVGDVQAGATYGIREQGMLQAIYAALKNYGLLE